MKIYVAGPYTPRHCSVHDAARIAHHNTRQAIKAGIVLIRMGHHPYVPHLTHYVHLECREPIPEPAWYEQDMVCLAECEALFLLGKSPGADSEVKVAGRMGIPIYHSIGEVPDVQAPAWTRQEFAQKV